MYEIFCDSLQEGMWFKNLNQRFSDANFVVIPNSKREQVRLGIDQVLIYDRPDIILKHNGSIILVLERKVEVPSGHNVGQRFGRLVAAAKQHIPVVYFGPYAAYKHGGSTAGPRYMNLRLFYSLRNLSDIFNTAITTINWPVDRNYEVLKTQQKDIRMRQYIELFLNYYTKYGLDGLTEYIKNSKFQEEQIIEQKAFAENEIRNPEQYNNPPESVEILTIRQFERVYHRLPNSLARHAEQIVVYNIGMNYLRSDPYAGMSALYYYLYCGNGRIQILLFPNISIAEWNQLGRNTKTYRMFKEFGEAILFQDGLLLRDEL